MSDPRRQPPSPLVFSPETVLAPIPIKQASYTAVHSTSNASRSDTVSMPFVKRHVTRRLKTAKAECDKELQRVTNSITSFFEDKLRESDADQLQDDRETHREFLHRQGSDSLQEPFVLQASDLRSALGSDDTSSDGGYEAELEYSRHSRQRASLEESPLDQPRLIHWSSSPALLIASNSSSPSSLRRQLALPSKDKPLSGSSSNSPALSPPEVGSSPKKQLPAAAPLTSWSNTQGAAISRRLSRSIHIPVRPVRSGRSSRSTSRSRSPLPRQISQEEKKARRSSRVLIDDPVDPIMTTLYNIISVATDITEMSIGQITSQPKICEQLVQRVQNIGKAWDEHPDWHGRNWYVQVLLAVASLSRVIEWWEAEKQFWNFDEDNEDDQDEPLIFVMKPVDETQSHHTDSNFVVGTMSDPYKLSTDEDKKLRMVRPPSLGRRSRDEATKDISITPQKTGQTSDEREASNRSATKFVDTTESARVLATERLRLQAETAQNLNIVMELSLDGDQIIWINYAWQNVVGTDPAELQGSRLSRMLSPNDLDVFKDATRRLLEDDSHTMEIRFKLHLESEDEREAPSYLPMEGKGMMMIDREEGQPSHTMWVIKPVSLPQLQTLPPSILLEQGTVGNESGGLGKPFQLRSEVDELTTPFQITRPINTSLILCRICECNIPQWYFEKHNETCSESHRLEAEIGDCNESVVELRNTIRELLSALDRSSPVATPEYRGMPIFAPSSSPGSSSPLQMFRAPLKMQKMGVKKLQRQLLEKLEDILLVAWEVSIPALKEDESKEPIERQRLLSPGSERKMSQVRNWSRPSIEDTALTQLVDDTERIMRQKLDNVVRLQNVIKYSEKTRHEWEEKVEELLASFVDEQEGREESEDDDEEEEEEGEEEIGTGDEAPATYHSSITSEYAFGAKSSGILPSSEPTPIGSASPAPSLTRSDHRHGWTFHTRPSTPSSISSPLALAIPITASRAEDIPPHMDLNDNTPGFSRSPHNLEARQYIPPTLSPVILPVDIAAPTRRSHGRRLSTMAPIMSPSNSGQQPLSPRLPPVAPLSRTTPTSIKDFEIIKPISKGAFGSVFLARKKATGDYFAIKVLKKADMIAKNQITNVKAERMILMQQAESPFVAKLYWTFQSKENLYLVMEYLNGGDCAALIKSLGSLPEVWTKNYIAEVVLGLEYLHDRGVVHRDLKPDNLLIDQQGHLKLTDFGLSRIGLLGRQTREGELLAVRPRTRYSPNSRPPSIDAAYLNTPYTPEIGGSYFNQRPPSVPRIATSPYLASTDDVSESSGSESLSGPFPRRGGASHRLNESPLQSFASELTNELRSHSNSNGSYNFPATPVAVPSFIGSPQTEQKFVGTPDYLAPETILGLRGDDAAVDWWALGVITYEFLYGIPPFHDDTPEKVFENILSGHIEWHGEWVDYSPEARDFMQRLMTLDPIQRLGANCAEEVKAHPFFAGIDWTKVTISEAAFIPQVTDPESTDYFDPRGAVLQNFHDEDQTSLLSQSAMEGRTVSFDAPPLVSATIPVPFVVKDSAAVSPADDDFGTFSFKNLPVLKQANDDVIRKLKTDQMAPMSSMTLAEPSNLVHTRRRSLSQRMKKPPSNVIIPSVDPGSKNSVTNPPSPATSTSSIASSPSRGPSTPGSTGSHVRKPSEFGAVERFKLSHLEGDLSRRNSMPSRLRTASVSTSGEDSVGSSWPTSVGHASSVADANTPPSSVASIDLKRAPDPNDRAVTCLLAEDNPITAKIIETLLIRLGCRCVVVADGSEAISVAMGDIKFDCILMDLQMPILDGEGAARYIKSTNNKNASTPIIAVSAYSGADTNDASNLFAASLAKPLQKADLVAAMRQLGFKTTSAHERIVPKQTR